MTLDLQCPATDMVVTFVYQKKIGLAVFFFLLKIIIKLTRHPQHTDKIGYYRDVAQNRG